jgi:hypothetical protein
MDLKSEKAKDLTKREVFILLREYLDEQIELSRRKTLSEDSFSLPSWSEFQAYQLGIQRAYFKLKDAIPDQGESK